MTSGWTCQALATASARATAGIAPTGEELMFMFGGPLVRRQTVER